MYLRDVSNETYACLHTLRTQNVIMAALFWTSQLLPRGGQRKVHRLGCAPRCGRKQAKRSDKCQDCITFESASQGRAQHSKTAPRDPAQLCYIIKFHKVNE